MAKTNQSFGWGWEHRAGKQWWKLVTVTLEDIDDTTIEGVCDALRKAAEGLETPTVSLGTEDYEYSDTKYEDYEYSDTKYPVLRVEGWRRATESEVAVRKAEMDNAELDRRNYEQREIDRLKASRPELFK